MSADYVGQELESEFGRIPPSFLPLGNRRLFQHQVKLAPEGVSIYLSIPESYQVSEIDKKWLSENSVNLIYTPDGLTLGASLVAALNLANHNLDSPLHILFGDTLFSSLPTGNNIVSISEIKDSYDWAIVTNDNMNWIKDNKDKLNPESDSAVTGYFKFNQPRELMRCITQSNWHFLNGLNVYHKNLGLTTVNTDDWLDFGHVNTYYRSKASFTTQRAFNELVITPEWVEKSSIKNTKIAAEAHWFDSIPSQMRGYIPQFLGAKTSRNLVSYRLEYLHLTALNELFVFSELPDTSWNNILKSCLEFIKKCTEYSAPKNSSINNISELFGNKTEVRLNEYCSSKNIKLGQVWNYNDELSASLEQVLECSKKYLPAKAIPTTLLHGDFCFSNILYDFRADKIKVIDPRGLTYENELTIYGDIRYDIAKLSHSVLGMYDWIIAGYYNVEIHNHNIQFNLAGIKQRRITQQRFTKLISDMFDLSALNLYAMQIQLFLSMLPLHADDSERQKALFANTFRLYQIIKRLEK